MTQVLQVTVCFSKHICPRSCKHLALCPRSCSRQLAQSSMQSQPGTSQRPVHAHWCCVSDKAHTSQPQLCWPGPHSSSRHAAAAAARRPLRPAPLQSQGSCGCHTTVTQRQVNRHRLSRHQLSRTLRGQAATHTQQRRSSQPGQVLAGLSHDQAVSPRLQGQQSRSLTGSDQARAAGCGPARSSSHRCCAQAASVAAPLPNAMVRVRIGLAASTGRLDLSECDLTEVPLAACELTDLQVCWALRFWRPAIVCWQPVSSQTRRCACRSMAALLTVTGHGRRFVSWQSCRCAGCGSTGGASLRLQALADPLQQPCCPAQST